jgi:hypothetical protein
MTTKPFNNEDVNALNFGVPAPAPRRPSTEATYGAGGTSTGSQRPAALMNMANKKTAPVNSALNYPVGRPEQVAPLTSVLPGGGSASTQAHFGAAGAVHEGGHHAPGGGWSRGELATLEQLHGTRYDPRVQAQAPTQQEVDVALKHARASGCPTCHAFVVGLSRGARGRALIDQAKIDQHLAAFTAASQQPQPQQPPLRRPVGGPSRGPGPAPTTPAPAAPAPTQPRRAATSAYTGMAMPTATRNVSTAPLPQQQMGGGMLTLEQRHAIRAQGLAQAEWRRQHDAEHLIRRVGEQAQAQCVQQPGEPIGAFIKRRAMVRGKAETQLMRRLGLAR